jgi:ribonuclease J
MDATQLYFIPLGGTGEIGMNLNAYRYDDQWLLIDCGVMFVRRTPTESDATFATLDALNIYPGKIAGLILTHAHQDHIGAVADLWPQLQCPVYGTRFTIEMLNGPLKEAGLGQSVPMHALDLDARFRVGPFDLQRIPLTHSTVEMGAFVIRTEAATVLHTGDWTFDSEPVVGQLSDQAALMRLHDEPIHALVCDSTNATTDGWTASE